jgi:hypothetical protein
MGIYDQLSQMDTGPTKPNAPARKQTERPVTPPSAPTPPSADTSTAVRHDVTAPTGPPALVDLDYRRWRDTIENTQTAGSALRLTAAERERIEDLVRDLRRGHRIKTSMNELARLGLLVLEHDFRRDPERSVIRRVKDS